MIVFPHAKINIGLSILDQRPDGLHTINSCFYPVAWYDVLEIVESSSFLFSRSGIPLPGEDKENLCVRAFQLLQNEFLLPPIKMHLHKNIPVGAGLGGGSSDAAFTLSLLNEKFNLDLSSEQLETFAVILGSDCPYFIHSKPLFVSGTGGQFSSINLDLSNMFVAIIYPNLLISTKEAYAQITPKPAEKSLKTLIEQMPCDQWNDLVINDFEENLSRQYPVIRAIKKMLIENGAVYASMTGSGSAIYGFFKERPLLTSDYPMIVSGMN